MFVHFTRLKAKNMKLLKIMKSWYVVISCLLLIIFWLLFHQPCAGNTVIAKTTRLVPAEFNSGSKRLSDVLRKASTEDRIVILAMVNNAWAAPGSILDLFLESFRVGERTKQLLNHLVVVALDDQALQYCEDVHPHCYLLTNSRRIFTSRGSFENPDGPVLAWRKKELLKEVLEQGYSLVFTEADVMWLRNPITKVSPANDLTLACGFSSGEEPKDMNIMRSDGGFIYIKSEDLSGELFKILDVERFVYPGFQDQSLCQITRRKDLMAVLNKKIEFLGTDYFGGLCQRNLDMSKICTIHANCCDDINSKVHDLKLVLEDWRNGTAGENHGVQRAYSSWRAPSKCK